jgi:hypothetical protein
MASLFRRGLPAIVLAGTGGVLLARFDHTEALTVGLESDHRRLPLPRRRRPRPRVRNCRATHAVDHATSERRADGTTDPLHRRHGRRRHRPRPPGSAAACSGAETLGPVVQTKWGPVQVAAIISQGRICDVRAVVVPSSHARSAAINSRAVPILRQRVLDAQSAAFDTGPARRSPPTDTDRRCRPS